MMRFGSVCSGIEAASCAWHPLGWQSAFLSEIEPFPCSVLAHHYPTVPNLGDMIKFKEWPHHDIDVLVGGTPCQSFSVAGLRKGLADPRGNLMLTYLAITDQYRPRWLVWENVPGVLSSNGGKDFGTFLGGLGELGYGFAYRVLDAQYIRVESHTRAVPQRRRRVFVVGYFGDWRRAAAVLFERESLCGHPAPSRKAGEEVAGPIMARTTGGGGFGGEFECSGGLQPVVSKCLVAGGQQRIDAETETLIPTIGGGFDVAHALRGEGFDASEDGTGRGTPIVPIAFDCKASGQNGFGVGEIASTLRSMGHANSHQNGGGHLAVAFAIQERAVCENVNAGPQGSGFQEGVAYTLEARHKTQYVAAYGVRRLTPMECERLQGFPDDYTQVPHCGKPAADGPRYKALGNSMAVPVMRWIGERIQAVDEIQAQEVAA